MSEARQKLQEALGFGYRATVLHQIPLATALERFNSVAIDPDVMAAAKQELQRSSSLDPKRCFASNVNAKFLRMAIDNYTPPPVRQINSKEQEDMTSKLKALAGLAKATVDQVETDAEAAIEKLQAAQVKAQGGVAKINSVASEIEGSANALEDFANQITNGGPPLDH